MNIPYFSCFLSLQNFILFIQVDVDLKSCHCGHVFKQVKSINGKRFTGEDLFSLLNECLLNSC